MTTSHAPTSSILGRLRKATAPEAVERVLPLRLHGTSVFLSALALVLVVLFAGSIDVLLGVNVIALWVAALYAERKVKIRCRPFTLPRWAALLSAAAVAPLYDPFFSVVPPWLALGVAVLWVWSPWLGLFSHTVGRGVGWGKVHRSFSSGLATERGDDEMLTITEDPEEYERYQPQLRSQLDELGDDWEVLEDRCDADAVLTGPGGVALIYSVSPEPARVVTATPLHADNAAEIARDADLSLREIGNTVIAGSRAHQLTEPTRPGQQRDLAEVQAVQIATLEEANSLRSQLQTTEGDDMGERLPAFPVQVGRALAEHLQMPAEHSPTVIYVGHGLSMDSPWGQVEIMTSDRGWVGSALLCHPRHVGECVDSLPGMLSSNAAIEDAQHAVDLALRLY